MDQTPVIGWLVHGSGILEILLSGAPRNQMNGVHDGLVSWLGMLERYLTEHAPLTEDLRRELGERLVRIVALLSELYDQGDKRAGQVRELADRVGTLALGEEVWTRLISTLQA